jgi:hypothetical protein
MVFESRLLVDGRLLVGSQMLALSGDHDFGLGLANDENGLGVLQDAGDGRQRVVGRVDF